MNLNWLKVIGLTFALVMSAAVVGCEVDDAAEDGTTAGDTAGGDTAGGDTAETDTGNQNLDPCDNAEEDCVPNGYCCWLCEDSAGDPTDIDCNPNTISNSDKGKKTATCDCDFWGFVCEAESKPSENACQCDPDCTFPDGTLESPCIFDSHCDTYCPAGADPDC